MLEQSDVISFHNYKPLPEMKGDVEALKRYGRPILCTEYMARPAGSPSDPILAYLKSEHVGAYNWGFVAGKTQTIYPWNSWQKPYTDEPSAWSTTSSSSIRTARQPVPRRSSTSAP